MLDKEANALIKVQVMFSLSYLCRFIYDEWLLFFLYEWDPFAYFLVMNGMLIIFDIVPLALIMFVHYSNFSYNGVTSQPLDQTLQEQNSFDSTDNTNMSLNDEDRYRTILNEMT